MLQKKVLQLNEDLEHAQAAASVADAGQELMAKKELDAIKGKLSKDLEKARVKIQKLERQIKAENRAAKAYAEEIEAIKKQMDDLTALNAKLQSKVDKFSEAANKAADMKDQLRELTQAYKEIAG